MRLPAFFSFGDGEPIRTKGNHILEVIWARGFEDASNELFLPGLGR
jgi:hypothetical protein